MNQTEIERLLPHRPPFLFVDDVVECSDERIISTYYADPDAAYFKGHFPGNPVMPGVLQCECALQAGALLIGKLLGPGYGADGLPVVTRIKDAKFRRVVRPGETVRVEATLKERVDDVYFMTGRIAVNGAATARVEFACTVTDIEGME